MITLIDKEKLRKAMYHEAFEAIVCDDQMWDGGCWIRYRLFERVLESMPVIKLPLEYPDERSEE